MTYLIRHRVQLGVYLRLLAISIPSACGPSAEDDEVILINRSE